MKNLKKFETHAEYEAFKASDSYVIPNVSWCLDNNEVYFEPYDLFNGHKYVDLALPSGTLWAKCNVGAETETDYGLYFAWGETQGYTSSQVGTDKNFAWSDYKYGAYDSTDTPNHGMTKYNATDGKYVLDIEDDAAHVNMGGIWVMPTIVQIAELVNESNTSYAVVTKSGVTGMEFTSVRNGNTLFIPFSGSYYNGSSTYVGRYGYVWSSSLTSPFDPNYASNLFVDNEGIPNGNNFDNRCVGLPVRGVCQNSPQQ